MRLLVAGISTRAAAAAARRCSDLEVVGLDYFGDRDQRLAGETYALSDDFGLAPSPANLVRAARALRYDAMAYTSSLENHPLLVAQLGEGASRGLVLGNPPHVLGRVRHVPALARLCRGAGIPFPRTLVRGLPAPAPRGTREAEHWLEKPRAAGGGHGIRHWAPADGPPGPRRMLQCLVPGRSFSATVVANGRQAVVVGLAEGLAGQPAFGAAGFTYCGSLVPPRGDRGRWEALLPRVRAIATALTEACGLVGLNGLDFIAGPGAEEVTLLEVNPRYSASMEVIECALGAPLFAWHCRAIVAGELPTGGDLPALPAAAGTWGKAIVYARRDVRMPDTDSWLAAGVRDVPPGGQSIPRGAPICTVLYHATDGEQCLAGLRTAAAWIEAQLLPPAGGADPAVPAVPGVAGGAADRKEVAHATP